MEEKIFTLKKSDGVVYNFYFSQTGGICYKIYSLYKNEKEEPFEVSITDEKILEFYATLDNMDNIHILALTENGDLKYFINTDNTWNNKVFSHFDLRSNIIKSLFIHVINKKIYIMYATSNIMNANLWTIYFKSWNGVSWKNLNVGMTLCEKEFPPYFAVVDYQNNIHIIYKNLSNKGSQLFYRKFHIQFELWSTPEKIIYSPEVIGYYYCFCDYRGNCHICWTTKIKEANFKIHYKKINKKVLNNQFYNRNLTLNTSNTPYLQPIIFEIDQKIWVMWRQENEFYGCEIEDLGLSCGETVPVSRPIHSSPTLIEYINNYEQEKQNFNGRMLYATIDDYINLILPKNYACNFFDNDEDMPRTEPEAFDEDEDYIYNRENFPISEIASLKQNPEYENKTDLYSTLEEKFSELKSEYEEITDILQEIKTNYQDTLNTVKNIQSQNLILINILNKLCEKDSTEEEKQAPKKTNRFFDLFGR